MITDTMNTIPEALVPAAEALDAHGSIPVDDTSKEAQLFCELGFAEKFKKYGPEPEPPKQRTKRARDLRPGDYLVFRDKSYYIERVAEASPGHIPYPATHVYARGLKTAIYPKGKRATISEGPILEQETWEEIRLNKRGQTLLELHRLSIAPETPSPEPEWLGEGRIRVGTESITLEQQERFVLQALVACGSATKPELEKRSGVNDAIKVLKRIREKFPALAEFIIFPGGRGKGGYRTTIVDKSVDPSNR